MTGPLLLLDSGVTVVLAEHSGDRWWRAIILASSNPACHSGGPDIIISERDVERAQTLVLTDGVVQMLAFHVPVNGPAPTLDSFLAKIRE